MSVIRGSVVRFVLPFPLLIVSQVWPAWLVVAQAFDLPIAGAFFPTKLHRFFKSKDDLCWYSPDALERSPIRVGVIGVISGSIDFIRSMRSFVPDMDQCIVCVEPSSFRALPKNYLKQHTSFVTHFLGMNHLIVAHADYGGCTSAKHICGFGSDICSASNLPRAIPTVQRSLEHFLSVAVEGCFSPHPAPEPLSASLLRTRRVLYAEKSGIVRREGLLPCHKPDALILCPSVFGLPSMGKYVTRTLTLKEALRIYSIPSSLDSDLLDVYSSVKDVLPFESSVSADIIISFVQQLWGLRTGGGLDGPEAGFLAPALHDAPSIESSPAEGDSLTSASDVLHLSSQEDTLPVIREMTNGEKTSTSPRTSVFVEGPKLTLTLTKQVLGDIQLEAQKRIQEANEHMKAAKADDAEVPVHYWREAILEKAKTKPDLCSGCVEYALNTLREWWLKRFWKKLRAACITRLRENYNDAEGDWMTKPRYEGGGLTSLGVELQLLASVVWYSTEASWFEYNSGSALHYFRFPIFYQGIAKDGVPVFFEKKGPTSKRRQPLMSDESMRKTAAAKLGKVIKRGYVLNSGIRLLSLIKYFAVPKADSDYRMVYDATANELNDAVWAPSFWLPTVETLVRYIDASTWMMDKDIGDMFLNFPLDKRVWPYTGLDLGNLFDETLEADAVILEKAGGRWVHWIRCLMGFKPSPYNSIKTTLVVEEVVKGDRHSESNPYQWDHVRLNLPGSADYDPTLSWISKIRKDGLVASDLFTFVDDERVSGSTRELAREAGHRLGYIQAYLGIQDSARKMRPCSQLSGQWAGTVVHIVSGVGVCVLTSDQKWKRLKDILAKWLERLERGDTQLDHKELQSDRGFCVYLTRNYPAMIPYLKGFHLTIEMWRGNRDSEGWKLPVNATEQELSEELDLVDSDETSLEYELESRRSSNNPFGELTKDPVYICPERKTFSAATPEPIRSPPSGFTSPAPRFIDDLRALKFLSQSDAPPLRIIRCKSVVTVAYGFGDASGKGFCGTLGYHDSVNYRIGVWGRDADSESSNYKELRNLVETTEEEAAAGRLFNAEFFLFTDNSTAENSFYRGSSKSKSLHELVLRLRKLELEFNLVIHLIHVAGTRMIAQGTDGGSRGSLLEGVMTGKPMLDFVELAKSAIERYPPLLRWIRTWAGVRAISPLTPEQWFVEGHGINGGEINADGVWIPTHEPAYQTHLWCPPPPVADAALEELLKARHKRTDTYHIIVIPRLMTPRWRRLFYKACDFICVLPAGSQHWPANMFEPLYLGIVLPFTHHRPWQLKRAPLILEMEREMQCLLRSGEADGRDLLRKLLKLVPRLCSMSKDVARQVLHMPREEERPGIPYDGDGR